ncbi:MAG: 4Fe-4S binding protein [Candidatus Thorarchaeota archaeon]
MVVEIAVVSGKGGTGKTTITAAFAAIADNLILADCDVDAPDLHILLHPEIITKTDFIGSKVAHIDPELCTECGLCSEHCRFEAAHPPEIDQMACEGCSVCALVCPEHAIEMKDRVSGHLFKSNTRFGPMAHAKLLPGEGNSGKLVTDVRQLGLKLASAEGKERVLIDGSPGIGCPVIATVTGLTMGVVVTEPTLSGVHDMERILSLLQRFKVKSGVIINKYDINIENTEQIEKYCASIGVVVLGRVPFDRTMTKSMVAAKTVPEFAPKHELTEILTKIWGRIEESLPN